MNIHSREDRSVTVKATHKRMDIQALRGLAVLLVVFYHAGADLLPAGYLGVDVFFVISGFLITSLIARAIEQGDFSFRDFYYRRAKRLLPAAYAVILATVVTAPLFISDVAFEEMKAQVWGAVTFTINFVLLGQAGYFDGAAETKPLLHFWSLAIEEQYYLAMPLLLMLVRRRIWVPLLIGTFLVSLVACVWLAQIDSDFAFYLSPTRAWELCLGSLIALAPINRLPMPIRSLARIPALIALILVPLFPTGLPHPSLDALIVTVATALVIIGVTGSRAERSAPVRAFAFVGDFSYSLYLVHWPVIVFTRAAWLEQAPDWALYAAVLVSMVLSYLLFRLVEEPFRRGFFNRRLALSGALVAVSVCAAFSPAAVGTVTTSERDYAHIRRNNYGLDRSCAFGDKYPFTGDLPKECRTRPDAGILVWGDSYAMAWTSALMGPLGADPGVEQATRGACDPLLDMGRFPRQPGPTYNREYAKGCIDIHRAILDYAVNRKEIEIVALAGRFATVLSPNNMMLVKTPNGYEELPTSIELVAEGLAKLAEQLRLAGKRVIFLAPPPADGSEIGDCLERQAEGKVTFGENASCDLLRSDVERVRTETWRMLELAAQKSGATVFYITDFLCDEAICHSTVGGKFIYRDSGHLAYEGAEYIGERSSLAADVLAKAR